MRKKESMNGKVDLEAPITTSLGADLFVKQMTEAARGEGMKALQRKALAMMPLTEETVQSFYDGTRSGTAEQC
jgi:hypothetical protein